VSKSTEQAEDVVEINLDIRKINELLDYCSEARTREEIQEFCGIGSREYLMANVVRPLLESGRLRRTIPDKPSSSKQKYIKT